jgi:hypothetical protein
MTCPTTLERETLSIQNLPCYTYSKPKPKMASTVIAWQGPSPVDGREVILLLSAIVRESENRKTGDMVQAWILQSPKYGESPQLAYTLGHDVSICGNCPLRSIASGGNGVCYVNKSWLTKMYKGIERGTVPTMSPYDIYLTKPLRQGAYGDPAFVPLWVWEALESNGTGKGTSYTHQWRDYPELAQWAMASVSSVEEAAEAQALGFRTYRVDLDGTQPPIKGEIMCPYVALKDAGLQCNACLLCSGNRMSGAKSIVTLKTTA